ncbi:sterigmatocystin biosynthesis P450 monooxygenase [Phyllosticta citricarpa]|uniref:Sterigmatocystin biosynthesis P450 monooxygenase n=1 Tax=Phyllosticta citricarpa TaxID=55181 RepID=A0ABR1LDY7_9PEZI
MATTSLALSRYVESPTRLAGILVLFTVLFLVFQKIRTALTSPLRKIPGPLWSHVTHYPLKWAVITGQRTQFIHALHQKYGPLVRISPREVSCSDGEAARTIHKPNSGFVKTEWYKSFTETDNEGLFDTIDTKKHAARRRLMARAFSKSEIRARWEPMVHAKARLSVQRIEEECRRAGEADVFKWWTFLATDVSGTLMFGESFNMLEYGKKNEYIHVLEKVMKSGGIRAELPLIDNIGKMLPIAACQTFFNATIKLTQYGTKAVANSRRDKKVGGDETTTIFAQLDPDELAHTAYPLTDADINREAGNLIAAGSDTTAVTLTYLTWSVLQRPRLLRALEAEVAAALSPSEPLTDAALEARCPLLNASINEALRLYGAAPGSLPRRVPSPSGATLAGFFVPPGATVSTQAWSIHRDAAHWQDPETFAPERWLGLPATTAPSSLHFQPFGAGTRTCLGLHLALMELRVAMAVFLKELRGRVGLSECMWKDEGLMEVVNFFLIRPKGEKCMVVVGERQEEEEEVVVDKRE